MSTLVLPRARRIGHDLTDLANRPNALYGTAMLRIGYALAYLIFLLRELPHREQLWGPNAAWTPALEDQYAANAHWYGWIKSWNTLLATTSDTRFELGYAIALLICAAMVLGWHTRAASVGFMLVVTTFTARDVFLGDGGDNVLLLMSIYLVFTACGRRASLDSRRPAARAAAPRELAGQALAELAEVRRRVVALIHNAAILVIGFQMCVIYGAAALWKAQGPVWQNGTALYYVLHINWFRAWPGLSDTIAGHSTMIAIVAYLTVFAQIGFPFAVFSKKLKYTLLVILLGMHLSIAVLLGIPEFSAVMIIGDSVFLPDTFWLAAGRLVRTIAAHLLRRRPEPAWTAPGGGELAALQDSDGSPAIQAESDQALDPSAAM
ncbi:MAG TPA: HTTM domain-containing protein [Actinocrinis sp.]|nr:HTTM domain-containing protein [Actinocrinis sp.]